MYGKKSRGSKIFGNEGEGRFREILSCPPKMHVAPQMPPQIPRPGAATDFTRIYFSQQAFLVLPVSRPLY